MSASRPGAVKVRQIQILRGAILTHKHKCSQGHVWEHGPTSSTLSPEDWKKANNAAHTCGVCGESGVFTRFLNADETERQMRAAQDAGKYNAGQLFTRLEEISPDIEPAEMLATIYYFTTVALKAYAEVAKRRKPETGGVMTEAELSDFWSASFGDQLPNPFTKEGVNA